MWVCDSLVGCVNFSTVYCDNLGTLVCIGTERLGLGTYGLFVSATFMEEGIDPQLVASCVVNRCHYDFPSSEEHATLRGHAIQL